MPATAAGVVHASVDALAHVAAAPLPLEVTLPLPPSPAAPSLDPKFHRLRAWLLDNGASGPGIDRWRVARSPLGGHGIFTDYGLEQSETLANVPYKLMMTAAVDGAQHGGALQKGREARAGRRAERRGEADP